MLCSQLSTLFCYPVTWNRRYSRLILGDLSRLPRRNASFYLCLVTAAFHLDQSQHLRYVFDLGLLTHSDGLLYQKRFHWSELQVNIGAGGLLVLGRIRQRPMQLQILYRKTSLKLQNTIMGIMTFFEGKFAILSKHEIFHDTIVIKYAITEIVLDFYNSYIVLPFFQCFLFFFHEILHLFIRFVKFCNFIVTF